VLMHCKSGSDRTGLAAAMWLLTQENAPLDVARAELSLRYLHRRESETGVLDVVLDQFGEAPKGTSFEDWVRNSYDPDTASARAKAEKPKRGKWAEFRAILGDLYRYAQFREARWHKSFEIPIETPQDEKRANFFMKWVDHGILRGFWTNRAEIADGIIRSNHPTRARFQKEAARGLRTVVNLRGASRQPQYLLEAKICADLGLTLIDLPMNATRAPRKEVLLQLLDTFETAERPLLMHCKSGADRTGLAAALYLLTQGETVDAARGQLSAKFLHFRRGKKAVLDEVLDEYARHSDLTVRAWITDHYDPSAF